MIDAAVKPKWGWVDLIIVYIGTLLLTLLGTYLIAPKVDDVFAYFTAGTLMQFTIIVGLVLIFAVSINKAPLSELGFRKASGHDLLVYGLLGGFVLMVFMILIGIPISRLQDVQPQVFEQMLRSAGQDWQFLVLIFLGAVIAPISEELFYRGMVYPVFRGYLGSGWGSVAAGLVFGLAHWDLWRTIPLAIGGAALCYMYEKTGSIWVTMLAHGTWNGLMSLMVYFSFLV